MNEIWAEVRNIWKNKAYSIPMVITAVLAYGYKITHFAIGIDDTPYYYYFTEGMNVLVGRWVLFVLNKALNIGKLLPFMTDFAGVMLLMLSASLYVVAFKRVVKKNVSISVSYLFSALFITCPLICEVYTYFLHNGISIGYVANALALLMFLKGDETVGKRKWADYFLSAVFLFISIGCYESFASVFLAGVSIMLLIRVTHEVREKSFLRNIKRIGLVALIEALSIVFRALMQKLLIVVFNIHNLRTEEVSRSVTEMLGWVFTSEGRAGFVMALKRFFVMYGVFGIHYLSIAIFLLASLVILTFGIFMAIRKKSLWAFVYMMGIYVSCIILMFIEGSVTLYRSAQFLPLVSAYGITLFFMAASFATEKIKRFTKPVLTVLAIVILFRQIVDMNNWFYIDTLKYEEARRITDNIAEDILRTCENAGKPIIFAGEFHPSVSIIEDAYVPFGSEEYERMKKIVDIVDPELMWKFFRRNRFEVAQTPTLSVISWGQEAFLSSYEVVRFMNMSGYTFVGTDDIDAIRNVPDKYLDSMETYPKDGYIYEDEDYIIVNMGMGY